MTILPHLLPPRHDAHLCPCPPPWHRRWIVSGVAIVLASATALAQVPSRPRETLWQEAVATAAAFRDLRTLVQAHCGPDALPPTVLRGACSTLESTSGMLRQEVARICREGGFPRSAPGEAPVCP